MMQRKGLQLVGLAAVIAMVAVTVVLGRELTTTRAAAEPEMELTVSSPAGVCAGETCTIGLGEDFTLQVNAVKAPAANYIGMQTFIDYGSDLVFTKGVAEDEITWPDGGSLNLRGQTGATFVNHSDLSGIIPPLPESTHVGSLVEMAFTCSAGASSTVVELIPINDPRAVGDGSAFVDPDGVTQYATDDTLTIDCAEAPADTPTPTSPPATVTPTPSPAEPGDVNCDGNVTSVDSLFILQLVAALTTFLPCPDVGDLNGDGETDALDALFVLQIVAGLL